MKEQPKEGGHMREWPGDPRALQGGACDKMKRGMHTRSMEKTRVKSGLVFSILSKYSRTLTYKQIDDFYVYRDTFPGIKCIDFLTFFVGNTQCCYILQEE